MVTVMKCVILALCVLLTVGMTFAALFCGYWTVHEIRRCFRIYRKQGICWDEKELIIIYGISSVACIGLAIVGVWVCMVIVGWGI